MYILESLVVEVSGYYFFLIFSLFVPRNYCSLKVWFIFSVSGGLVSLVQGSYEYYHYLQDGFDDSVLFFLHLSSCIKILTSFLICRSFCFWFSPFLQDIGGYFYLSDPVLALASKSFFFCTPLYGVWRMTACRSWLLFCNF